jgi:multiple sugar transport system permease protein
MKKRSKINKDGTGYLFIAPYFIAFFIFSVYPLLYTIYLSFSKWGGTGKSPQFIGIDNYVRLISDPVFFESIKNTFLIWFMCIIPQMIFALLLAVILTQSKIKGKEAFRAVYFLPNLMTMASVAVLFIFIMDWKTGALNIVLMKFNIIKEPINWFMNANATRTTVAFINWWMWFGYSMIIFMSGIKSISHDVIEAAIVDGANKWQLFKSITFPLIRPSMIYSMITSLIGGMALYDVPAVLTNGDGAPQGAIRTTVIYLYNTAFKYYNFGYGAAIGVGLFVLMIIAVAITYKFINRNNLFE